MAGEPTMLELLRSRLTDLEVRQRATGGAAEGGFWGRFAGRVPSPPSEPAALTARAVRRARRVAPSARPAPWVAGPWSGLAPAQADSLEQLDLRHPTWLDAAGYEQMVDDPAWVESTSARAEASASIDEAIVAEASAGLGLTRHAEAELTAAAERVARQRRTHEVTLVTIVSELVSRGIEAPDGLSRTDWLRSHDPSLTAGQAKAFVTVGTALADARWARLRLLVATQQVTVGNAAQIVDFEARTTPVADPDDLVTALADLTEQAPRLRPEELARLVRHHSEQVRPPRDEDRLDRGRREARGLWFTQPNATGMVGLRGVLDPEGAAVLKAAIDPLSIPCPEKDEHGRTVTPDDRTPARRRMDALLTMVQRGVASADGVPTTDKAKVVVLIDLETLVDDVRGTGTTLTGDVLSPGVVRRIACDAEIIPMVLGRDSEPLDVGRSQRLFTRGQRLALIARDQGCSFDGCTVPATWCDAHHVVHWRHGGCTSVDNGALLCPKHHTEVHDRDLTATVAATGVTWHT
ncbi:HNH endonuclease signature motif containing protein [Terrabacter sp. Root85]|uniref:HNH endonuclease signature motif containing protein n=1 Tax=Terrabacter sp. Root85 TaxID=1736603 RepID=UPI001F355FD8|nr:HNH endonuclease signature motif containing protein [Terrabacter sp. Root85]